MEKRLVAIDVIVESTTLLTRLLETRSLELRDAKGRVIEVLTLKDPEDVTVDEI